MGKNIVCGCCSKRTNSKNARRIANAYAIQYMINKYPRFHKSSRVCPKCYTEAYKKNKKIKLRASTSENVRDDRSSPTTSDTQIQVNEDLNVTQSNSSKSNELKDVTLNIRRTIKTHSHCIICKTTNNLKKITLKAQSHAFINSNIIIPSGSRCCSSHLCDGLLSEDAMKSLKVFSESTVIPVKELESLMQEVRKIALKKALDFDNPTCLSDNDYYQLTGISRNDFEIMANSIKNSIHLTSTRTHRTCLALLLVKLRTGLSHSVLSVLFKISRRVIGKCIHTVTKALMVNFVPLHLGLEHISREDFIKNHTRKVTNKLFTNCQDDVVILIVDGTYIYIEKSNNYSFQRRTFSMHKHRPLVKPMILVSTTGFILEVLGPYYADGKNNDASIFNSVLSSESSRLRKWLSSGDILIVDRGFRDSVELIEDIGLIPKMPHFLENKNQHTTIEANESRLITSVRWVVESINGLIKRWKALGHVIPNCQIPLIGDYVRIVCAICNAFRPPRVKKEYGDEIIAERMLRLVDQPNHLKSLVERENWMKQRVIWQKIDAQALNDFPKLTLEELRTLTIGIYQIKQAKSYTEEHFSDSGLYYLLVHKERNDIIRVQLQSRHRSSKIYNAWIQYNNCCSPPISSWYCQCKVGARVVGCCAHIAAVLWYLGYQRHVKEERPHTTSYDDFILDAATSNWSESDETENEESS